MNEPTDQQAVIIDEVDGEIVAYNMSVLDALGALLDSEPSPYGGTCSEE
jgi:hypothetical protein